MEKKISNTTTKDNNLKPKKDFGGFRKRKFRNKFKQNSDFEEKIVNISRVTNVVKGGRRFSFSVLVVIGNKKGTVGCGHGKAKEIPEAIKKAIKKAKNSLIKVSLIDNRTIAHDTYAKFISSKVLLKSAPEGKGLIASGAVRSVVELAGYKDLVTKSLGSSNKSNVVKATLKALTKIKTIEQIAQLRDISIKQVLY